MADSRSDSAITRRLRSNHDCLIAVFSHVFDLFSVVARARNHFHLDVLEAVYIKPHSPVLCQQKEYVSIVFGVNITSFSLVSHISNVCTFLVIHILCLGVFS